MTDTTIAKPAAERHIIDVTRNVAGGMYEPEAATTSLCGYAKPPHHVRAEHYLLFDCLLELLPEPICEACRVVALEYGLLTPNRILMLHKAFVLYELEAYMWLIMSFYRMGLGEMPLRAAMTDGLVQCAKTYVEKVNETGV